MPARRASNEKRAWLWQQDAYIDRLLAEGADDEVLESAINLRQMVLDGRMSPPS